MIISDYKVPESFERLLQRNFCAMKYVSELPERKRRRVMNKAKTMETEEEIRSYIVELGNKVHRVERYFE